MTVYSPATMPRGDDLLADRRCDLLAVDHDEVVGAAAIVAIERQEAGLAMPVPGDVAGRVLHEQVEIVRMVVRPVHRDDELRLGVDLAFLGIRRHREQREEEQEGDHLRRLEQHDTERIECFLARIEPELVHHGGVPRGVPRRRSSAGVTWVSVSTTASENTRWVAESARPKYRKQPHAKELAAAGVRHMAA
ncbi:hypothetical protein ACVW1C_007127 [Bradyrhizobium sp. USDA 4011]